MKNGLILDDLIEPARKVARLLSEKDYLYPESLKDSNPEYATHLESIGAEFYKDHPIPVPAWMTRYHQVPFKAKEDYDNTRI